MGLGMFQQALEAIPTVAASPLAFVAYVILIVGWLLYLSKRSKLKTIASKLESLPKKDRLKALELNYKLQPKEGLPPDLYLKMLSKNYFFYAAIGTIIAIVLLGALLVYYALESSRAKATAQSFTNVIEAMLIGTTAADDGRYAESLGFFRSTLIQHPTYTGWANLGYAYDELNQPADARIAFEEAMKIDPQNPSMYMYIGNTYKDQGELDKAIEYHTKALELFESSGVKDREFEANIRGNLGSVLYEIADQEQDPDKRVELANEVLNKHLLPAISLIGDTGKTSYIAKLLNNIGLTYKIIGNHDISLQYLERSLAVKHYLNADVSTGISYFNVADLEIIKGRYDKANELLDQAQTIFDIRDFHIGIGEVHRARGNIAWKLGDQDHALTQWQRAKVVFQAHSLGLYLDKVEYQIKSAESGEDPF
jgi:tetratricopeptide (TPR) repeat protein